ncbi:MAG: hypothetical protein JSV34_04630, partial [Candidatus Omnitrophota bacterium]
CLVSIFSYAEVPHLINYQGFLTDSKGKPLEGMYEITFRIYDAETGQGEMSPWEEVHTGINIQGGIFSVILGSITPLDLPFDKPYFLEIQVGDEVMSPRQRITSVGYAIRAERAEEADSATQAQNAATVEGGDNIIKAWIHFDGTGTIIHGRFNVTSVVKNSIGVHTITWDTDFANTGYCCVVSSDDKGFLEVSDYAVGSVVVRGFSKDGFASDHNGICVIACGDQ